MHLGPNKDNTKKKKSLQVFYKNSEDSSLFKQDELFLKKHFILRP